MWIAFLAAGSMIIQDLLATLLVQAEARNKAWLAALMDACGWFFGILTTTVSVTALQGHSLEEKILVIVLVSLANIAGTFAGVMIGKKYIRGDGDARG